MRAKARSKSSREGRRAGMCSVLWRAVRVRRPGSQTACDGGCRRCGAPGRGGRSWSSQRPRLCASAVITTGAAGVELARGEVCERVVFQLADRELHYGGLGNAHRTLPCVPWKAPPGRSCRPSPTIRSRALVGDDPVRPARQRPRSTLDRSLSSHGKCRAEAGGRRVVQELEAASRRVVAHVEVGVPALGVLDVLATETPRGCA
jgi:hypothetical protein